MTEELARADLRGDLLVPGDEEYPSASGTVFGSGAPAFVVRPHDLEEVAATIRYAAEEGRVLSVRSGGHSLLGHSTNIGGVVLDLRHFDGVELVEPTRYVVRVGGGATWGQVSAALARHGLALTAGDTSSVGVGGLTLGGGMGWMVRKYGLAIDNLISCRMVTANGRILSASEQENPELFWAVRGGGGNFGVVVSFDFAAQPVQNVHFGSITYQPDEPAGLIRGWRDQMRRAPDELSSTLTLLPPMMGMPASATVSLCYAGADAAAAETAIEPLLGIGAVTGNTVRVQPYAGILADENPPPGIRLLARNTLVPSLDEAAVTALAATYESGANAALTMRSLGGVFSRVPAAATAFTHRDAEAMVLFGTFVAEDATDADVSRALAPWDEIARCGTGTYLNFQGSATPADIAAAYPPGTYDRLVAVKRAYDPDNLFTGNHNISPGGSTRAAGAA